MTTITSRQNPLVARYRGAARRDDEDVVLLDGAHLVADAVEAGVRIHHAAITPAARDDDRLRPLLAALARASVEVTTVAAPVMAALSPMASPSPVIALAARPKVAEASMYRDPALAVVAVDVQDPGNVGAIIRVAEAAGATAVIAGGASADPFGWKALRGAMGSTLRLPVMTTADAAAAIARAREHGCRIVATTPRGGTSLFDVDLRRSVALVIGGEGHGLSSGLMAAADERITIPMEPSVESLNAAVTAALIVYEAKRQRDGK